MQLKQIVGLNVKRYRIELGLSQQDLSCISGISRQSVCEIERGMVNFRVDTLEGLSLSLEVEPASLFEMDNPEEYISLLLRKERSRVNRAALFDKSSRNRRLW